MHFRSTLILILICAGCTETLSGTYEDQRQTLRFEFQDEQRVLITSLDVTVRGTYVVQDHQVILHGPQGMTVLNYVAGDLSTATGTPLFRTGGFDQTRFD